METGKKIKYWELMPVYDEPADAFKLTTAAVVQCLATGKILDGMGGGGYFLCNEIVNALQNNGKPKVIIDADEYDQLLSKLK